MFLSTATSLAAILVSPVWARLDIARCTIGFDWNRNSFDQDPCTVGSILDASCRGLTEYAYPPLTSSTEYYLPPKASHSGDLMCDCNTVMYSLYMACASCQGGQIYSWTKWIPECTNIYVSQYPASIPQGTAIPHWAYYDIMLLPNQTWNDPVAIGAKWYPGELLQRADPEPSSDPPPVSSTSTTSTDTFSPAYSQGKVTSIKVPSGPPNPPVPSNSPDPTISTSTTDSPGPTDPVSDMDLPEPTTPTSGSTSSPRPTNRTSNTSSPRSTNPTGSNANLPVPTNAGDTKGATNIWAIVVILSLWTLV